MLFSSIPTRSNGQKILKSWFNDLKTAGEDIASASITFTNKTLAIADNKFSVVGSADATKIMVFDVSGITTGSTKTLTVPNASMTLLGEANTASVSSKVINNTNTFTARDDRFSLQASADTTKIAVFDLSAITTGSTKTLSVPNETGTLQLKKLTTKGDLLTYGSTDQRLAVGTDGKVLYADSSATEGVAWKDPYIQVEPQSSLTMTGSVTMNWGSAGYFYGTMAGDTTLSFSNVNDGRTVFAIFKGHASTGYTITFPTMIKNSAFTGSVKSNQYNVYTFTRQGGNIFATVVEDMT